MSNSTDSTEEGNGSERRAHVRYHSRPDTPLFAIGEQEVIHTWKARVRDISQGGVSLLVNNHFEEGTQVDIELFTPHADVTRLLLAKVVRVYSAGATAWVVGCAFETPLASEDVQQFV